MLLHSQQELNHLLHPLPYQPKFIIDPIFTRLHNLLLNMSFVTLLKQWHLYKNHSYSYYHQCSRWRGVACLCKWWWSYCKWGWHGKSFLRCFLGRRVRQWWLQSNLHALQNELPSLQKPAIIMQIQINDWRNANFSVKIMGLKTTAPYDRSANMSYMSYACYINWNIPHPWKMYLQCLYISTLGHELCPVGLTCCRITVWNSQLKHSFIVCKNT